MAVQAGFVAGTLLSSGFNLADVVNARRLFTAGCLAGAAANAIIPFAPTPLTIIVLRGITGMALACVYPPGLKIAAGWFKDRRGTALGIVVGALTIGSAFPHLLAWGAHGVPWRALMWTASALAVIGGVIVATMVEDGPYVSATAPFDPRAVVDVARNAGVRLSPLSAISATCGSCTRCGRGFLHSQPHRSLLDTASTVRPDPLSPLPPSPAVPRAASRRPGGRHVRQGAHRASRPHHQRGVRRDQLAVFRSPDPRAGAVCGRLGIFRRRRFSAVLRTGVRVQSAHARRHGADAANVGRILLTIASIRLLPWVASLVGWRWTFLVLVPGPVLGAAAMSALMNRRPISSDCTRFAVTLSSDALGLKSTSFTVTIVCFGFSPVTSSASSQRRGKHRRTSPIKKFSRFSSFSCSGFGVRIRTVDPGSRLGSRTTIARTAIPRTANREPRTAVKFRVHEYPCL